MAQDVGAPNGSLTHPFSIKNFTLKEKQINKVHRHHSLEDWLPCGRSASLVHLWTIFWLKPRHDVKNRRLVLLEIWWRETFNDTSAERSRSRCAWRRCFPSTRWMTIVTHSKCVKRGGWCQWPLNSGTKDLLSLNGSLIPWPNDPNQPRILARGCSQKQWTR